MKKKTNDNEMAVDRTLAVANLLWINKEERQPKDNQKIFIAMNKNPMVIFHATFIKGKFIWDEDGYEVFPMYWAEKE